MQDFYEDSLDMYLDQFNDLLNLCRDHNINVPNSWITPSESNDGAFIPSVEPPPC